MPLGKLSGKIALVTGAARGLGRAYGLRLASLGADVGIIDVNLHSYKEFEGEALDKKYDTVADELMAMGNRAVGVQADVSDFDQVKLAVKKIVDELGDITILVANAGGGLGGYNENKASQMNIKQYKRVLEMNLDGTVYTVSAVAPFMKKHNYGKIVTVSSEAGLQSDPSGAYAHYGAAKAAIIMYTKYLARELGPYNITANCIAPGSIATGRIMVRIREAGALESTVKSIPLGRLGTPEDCANVVEFLTTDLSDYVTGAVIDVSGGYIR